MFGAAVFRHPPEDFLQIGLGKTGKDLGRLFARRVNLSVDLGDPHSGWIDPLDPEILSVLRLVHGDTVRNVINNFPEILFLHRQLLFDSLPLMSQFAALEIKNHLTGHADEVDQQMIQQAVLKLFFI